MYVAVVVRADGASSRRGEAGFASREGQWAAWTGATEEEVVEAALGACEAWGGTTYTVLIGEITHQVRKTVQYRRRKLPPQFRAESFYYGDQTNVAAREPEED